MTANGLLQIMVFFGLIVLLTKPVGAFMARVFAGERTFLTWVLGPIERVLYRLFGVDPSEDMPWTTYTAALLVFSAVGGLASYALLRLQQVLPFNPQHFGATHMPADLAFNTAMSFTTNTNWQNDVPEAVVSYFSNMVALASHNWMSAAAGIAVAIAVVRGFARHSARGLGSFWADVTRATLYVLLPVCLVAALIMMWQGVPQNFAPYTRVTTLEGAKRVIAQGPVASQEVIKMVGTNGGGFFNANSAHPYENPTPLTDFLQIVLMFLIPAGLTYTFGRMVGNTRQGWAIFAAMALMFAGGLGLAEWSESRGNPNVTRLGVMAQPTWGQPGGNMEGKEVRFGIANSALFATVTTDASCGAVNSMHDSFTPLGGMVPLLDIMCDETIFGGVGAGLFGMLMYAVIAVFIGGLMVGRTPEYVGKKIEKYEVRMAILAVLILFANVMIWTALGANVKLPPGDTPQAFTDAQKNEERALLRAHPAAAWNHVNTSSPSLYDGSTYNNVNNNGAHGLSEILYQYASQTGNNGSAFAGLTGNTPWYNITGGLAMLIGRFLMIVPLLAMAGSLARKKIIPGSAGTLATDSATFAVLLAAVVLIVGALEYFPALALGPLVEHFQMLAGHLS
ncbi:MAG TPA: potassium-transporting ATPase subunit KdpA [Candidatus Eisenbacteria bacterium]|nr:potassium-transporting ATPase subunit KdpA [Candidatus Eisenbacteria bacterium]